MITQKTCTGWWRSAKHGRNNVIRMLFVPNGCFFIVKTNIMSGQCLCSLTILGGLKSQISIHRHTCAQQNRKNLQQLAFSVPQTRLAARIRFAALGVEENDFEHERQIVEQNLPNIKSQARHKRTSVDLRGHRHYVPTSERMFRKS